MSGVIFILSTLAIGVACSVPGVITGRILHNIGVVQDYKIKPIALTTFAMLTARLIAPDVSLGWMIVLGVLVSAIGVYRGDFFATSQQGPFWWERENIPANPWGDLAITIIMVSSILAVIWIWANQ